jgi:hypothetical protein
MRLKTPRRCTLRASLYNPLKRKGPQSRFRNCGPGGDTRRTVEGLGAAAGISRFTGAWVVCRIPVNED